jgi:hypothetical protein
MRGSISTPLISKDLEGFHRMIFSRQMVINQEPVKASEALKTFQIWDITSNQAARRG